MSKTTALRRRFGRAALCFAGLGALAAGCGGEPELDASAESNLNRPAGMIPIGPQPVCTPARPSGDLPELDGTRPTTDRYLTSATPPEIQAVIAEGYRPIRISAVGGGRFAAVFVANTHVSRATPHIEYDLTTAELVALASSTSQVRVMDVAPPPPASNGFMPADPRYAAIVEPAGWAFPRHLTQVLIRATVADVQAASGRVIDVEVEGAYAGAPVVTAVVLPDACDPFEQWIDVGPIGAVNGVVGAEPDRRVLTIDHVVGNGDQWVYVVETRPSEVQYPFWYDDLETTGDLRFASDVEHVRRRHHARFTELKPYVDTNGAPRYLASVVENGPLPVAGPNPSGDLQAVDDAFRHFIRSGGLPGGTLAIMDGANLVFARAYGDRGLDPMQAMDPETLLRIASVSKVLTALAILQLIDDGELAPLSGQPLSLSTRPFSEVLPIPAVPGPNWARLSQITIRQFLAHRSGLGRNSETIQDLSPSGFVAAFEQHPNPFASPNYSNSNFHVMGHVIELVTGVPYAQYVRQEVLEPLGLQHVAITRTLPASSPCSETTNYDNPGFAQKMMNGYGNGESTGWGFTVQASGGWAASAVDIARLGAGFSALLSPASDAEIHSDNLGFTGCESGLCLDKWGGYDGGTLSYLRAEHHGRWTYFWVTNGSPMNNANADVIETLLTATLPVQPDVSVQLPGSGYGVCTPFTPVRADLAVRGLAASPTTPRVGANVQVTFRVENRGTRQAPISTAQVTVRRPGGRPIGLPTLFTIPALGPGQRSAVQSLSFVAGGLPGTYSYAVQVDYGDAIEELDETNNTASGSVTAVAL